MSIDLEDAINKWHAAREEWAGGSGRETLEQFKGATNELLVAFSKGWQGDERSLTEAFDQFRKRLATDDEWDCPHRVK